MADRDRDPRARQGTSGSGAPVKGGRHWTDLLVYVAAAAALTVLPVLYVLATGAPWDGVAAAAALMMGVTTLLLLVATGGFYLLDEL